MVDDFGDLDPEVFLASVLGLGYVADLLFEECWSIAFSVRSHRSINEIAELLILIFLKNAALAKWLALLEFGRCPHAKRTLSENKFLRLVQLAVLHALQRFFSCFLPH